MSPPRIVTFGEVMLRLAPPGRLRLSQTLPGTLEATFGGAEVNVAVSVATQGGSAAFCTALPDNPITDAFVSELRGLGVDPSLILRVCEGRFGTYFVETGANQRDGNVVYDRKGSAMAITPPDAYRWESILAGATWFHVTGITPSLSAYAAEAAVMAVQTARQLGMRVACDLNFRKKLWTWEPGTPPVDLARKTMSRLLPSLSLLIANEEDAKVMLGIQADEKAADRGERALSIARRITEQSSNVDQVAITLREGSSADHNNWGAMLYDRASDQNWFAPTDASGRYVPYEIRNIVDRVGAGDSFAGALLLALMTPELSQFETALRYAVAASCLKHSIVGDYQRVSRAEVEGLMNGGGRGRVQR